MLSSGDSPSTTSMSPREDAGALSTLMAMLTSPILLTGGYAWGVTVEPSVRFSLQQGFAGKSALSLLCGLSSLLALAAGVVLERVRSRLAPWVGIWGFLGLICGCWLLAPTSIDITRLDSLRGWLGASGFALFALAWGVPDVFQRLVPEDDPRADISATFPARESLPLIARPVMAVAMAAAAALTYLAWRVHESPRSLLVQATAALSAVGLVTAAAEIAVARRIHHLAPAGTRLRRAAPTLLLLFALLAAAAAQRYLEG